MIELLARWEQVEEAWREAMRPPPKLTVSEWADEHYYMAPESSASPGKWKTLPYQREWMDAFSDPRVEQVSVMKSARVGFTQSLGAIVGYFIDHDPCPISVVQPTDGASKIYSKEFLDPMIKATPRLNRIVYEDEEEKSNRSANTILHKKFPGGVLSLIGANSGGGFRMVSRRVMLLDEPDAYRPSAGKDGDQIELAKRRSEAYWNRKLGAGCTPLIDATSKIKVLFEQGDQRRYHVPCPHCGHLDFLRWREHRDGGHFFRWDRPDGSDAHFICFKCGAEIEHRFKNRMVAKGKWVAAKPFRGHASFHIWAAYSPNINASWDKIAAEFIKANKAGPQKLKTFVNTVLGETWKERGEAPDWQRLYDRREKYPVGIVPEGALFLTVGMDVQKNRLVYEVKGWGRNKESWSIEADVFQGDTSDLGPKGPWVQARQLLDRVFVTNNGIEMRIARFAVDSGAYTQAVYEWVRRTNSPRVMAIKGQSGMMSTFGVPTSQDVDFEGTRVSNGVLVWPVGSDMIKEELYGWLRQRIENGVVPPGYVHLPEHPEDYFLQITAEQLVTTTNKDGFEVRRWQRIENRENHFLDTSVYARAAAGVVGWDRFTERDWQKLEEMIGKPPSESAPPPSPKPEPLQKTPDSYKRNWIQPRPDWLKKR